MIIFRAYSNLVACSLYAGIFPSYGSIMSMVLGLQEMGKSMGKHCRHYYGPVVELGHMPSILFLWHRAISRKLGNVIPALIHISW